MLIFFVTKNDTIFRQKIAIIIHDLRYFLFGVCFLITYKVVRNKTFLTLQLSLLFKRLLY